jgi:dephospho-CoA kinase
MTSGFRSIIGLTGLIGSGKTHARMYLESLGAVAVDADTIGHQAYKKYAMRHNMMESECGVG